MTAGESQETPVTANALIGPTTIGPATLVVTRVSVSSLNKSGMKGDRGERPTGRRLSDFVYITPAEAVLLNCVRDGSVLEARNKRPEARPPPDQIIRAQFVRFLILGGDEEHPVHEGGVWLKGAWIDGLLDLEGVSSTIFLTLENCELDGLLRVTDATLPTLRLEGTQVRALDADRSTIRGSVFLNKNFSAKQEVRFVGAHISGNLDCDGGAFRAVSFRTEAEVGTLDTVEEPPAALRLEATVVDGDVLLGRGFSAQGEVRLIGARVGQNLTCSGGAFNYARPRRAAEAAPEATNGEDVAGASKLPDEEPPDALAADKVWVEGDVYLNDAFRACGAVRLTAARIDGSLHCTRGTFAAREGGYAIGAQRMVVKGKFELARLRTAGQEPEPCILHGHVDLTAASVGSLIDGDAACWPENSLHLDGFHYDRINGSLIDAATRKRWLEKQVRRDRGRKFKPQPWEQAITFLRETGHPDAASKLAISKEWAWGWDAEIGPIRRFLHLLHGTFASFGYRPLTSVVWMSVVCCALALYYNDKAEKGFFGPTAPALQISREFKRCGAPGKIPWPSPSCKMPPEYTSFDPIVYSLDLILPLVDLQQEGSWAPITTDEAGNALAEGWWLRLATGLKSSSVGS
jgi:hypothetical protein